jgi:glycosyltransferase involved in cell wall biosynthesis
MLVYDSHELATAVPYRERAWARFVAAIERLVVPRCAAVITVSDGIAERLRLRYGLRRTPTVVRNVTALDLRGRGRLEADAGRNEHRGPGERQGPGKGRGLRTRLGIATCTPLILHQGAPAPDRGCEVLIAASAQLPGAHLAFLGDPEPGYAAALHREIDVHGVQDRVTLLPSVPLEELLANTAEADVGVTLLQDTCENHRLALPNKLFEYIAAGVPVVASDLPEIRRLVEAHGVGWCVPPGDPTILADALRRALEERADPGLGERLALAAAELNWPREQRRLVGLYARLAAASAGPRGVRSELSAHITAPEAPHSSTGPSSVNGSGAGHDQPVGAQQGYPSQRPVKTPRAARERGGERDRAYPQLDAQHGAQLPEANQTGVGVGSRHSRLPDRYRAPASQHPARLAER